MLYQEVLTPLINLSLENIDKDTEEYLKCIQTCTNEHILSWPNVASSFDLLNPLFNRLVGLTPRAGFGIGRHATDWQHKLTKKFLPKYDPIGKSVGRYALVPTVGEGFWDIGTLIRCVVTCQRDVNLSGEPCDSSTDSSCSKLPDIYDGE
jgi:hypothetical protein